MAPKTDIPRTKVTTKVYKGTNTDSKGEYSITKTVILNVLVTLIFIVMGRGGGIVVSVLAFYYDNPNLKPANN